MKSYPFDDALKILANVLERDGKKNRRAKKDRIKLYSKAVRLSLRSAAQAYIENKKHWGVGPAKARNRYISMHILAVGPEFSSQLIMLKESFRQAIIYRHEPGYFFHDLLPDGCVAFSPFPTARGRRASPSALRVPGGAAASAYFIE